MPVARGSISAAADAVTRHSHQTPAVVVCALTESPSDCPASSGWPQCGHGLGRPCHGIACQVLEEKYPNKINIPPPPSPTTTDLDCRQAQLCASIVVAPCGTWSCASVAGPREVAVAPNYVAAHAAKGVVKQRGNNSTAHQRLSRWARGCSGTPLICGRIGMEEPRCVTVGEG